MRTKSKQQGYLAVQGCLTHSLSEVTVEATARPSCDAPATQGQWNPHDALYNRLLLGTVQSLQRASSNALDGNGVETAVMGVQKMGIQAE